MSGHSKWSQIKRQKAVNDTKRGQIYTKIGREITVAVQAGGADPSGNFRLEQALAKARTANMPKNTIERSVERGIGGGPDDGATLDELTYEAYGPAGVGLLIEVVTDNRNRTVAEVRNALTRLGGTFADSGSVAWQFEARGSIAIAVGASDPEDIELMAIDAGALDVEQADETVHVSTVAADLRVCEPRSPTPDSRSPRPIWSMSRPPQCRSTHVRRRRPFAWRRRLRNLTTCSASTPRWRSATICSRKWPPSAPRRSGAGA